jgi:hypothetical protein
MKQQTLKTLSIIVLLACSFLGALSLVSATTYTITVASTAGGSIYFRVNGAGPQYGPGTYSYASGTPITFHMVASDGYSFTYFAYSGPSSGTTTGNAGIGVLDTTVLSSFTLTATYVATTTQYNVDFETVGSGSIQASWGLGTGSVSGTYSLNGGSVLSALAVPDFGYQFVNWTVSGFTDPSVVNPFGTTVSNDFTITAFFTANYTSNNVFWIQTDQYVSAGTQTYSSALGGHLTFDYDADSSGLTSYTYNSGTYQVSTLSTLTFHAYATAGYQFDHWAFVYGLVSGATMNDTWTKLYLNPQVITPASNSTMIAVFVPIPTYTPEGNGSGGSSSAFGFNWPAFDFSATVVIEMIIGGAMVFGGVLIFMRASKAWVVGTLLIMAGFFLQIIVQPNIYAVIAFGIEILIFVIGLYSTSGPKNK